MTSSETAPQSWAVAGAAAESVPVRRFVAGAATGLPNRSRAGPAGMDRTGCGPIGSLGGTRAMTASSSSAGSAARAPGVDVDTGRGRALDHGEPGVEAGAPPGIGPAVDGHGEDYAGAAVHRVEGVPPGGVAGDAVGRGDGGETSARRQHREGRAEVAQVRMVADAVDARRRGKRRVHQHHRRPDVVEPVGDGFRVEGGDGRLGKEPGQEAGAGLRVFVEVEMAGGGPCRARTPPSPPACRCRPRAPARCRPAGSRRP